MEPLSPEHWRQIEELLDAALDLPPDARAAFLDRSPAAGASVRAEVRRLLGLEERAERFLERPAAEFAASLLANDEFGRDLCPMPERIGPYRILHEAGHGGMGTVYLAERDDPQLRQRVALKLVSGEGTELLVRRFLEERQILASLEHPSIARLLDGGITADGLPWFAMEYVEGTPIDRYCDERGLGIEARLRLFLRVCEAVQYAHQKLVVHRDLKPSNILVTDDSWVKLLDFGIAKLLAPEASADAAGLTQTGLRPMTPEYASPEQIRGDAISTASDVYALGVLLYKLLTGQHPHPLSDRAPLEIARMILEEEPKPPSAVAAEGVRRRLRGDLDTIVQTTMRKEPQRRYATALQLAADVRRHLEGQPVSARPDTWRYRSGKFIRRHRAGVAAALAFFVLLVGYGVTVTIQARRIAREAAKTEQVKDFLASLFTLAIPAVSEGGEPTASDLVEEGARRVAAELQEEPEIQAELMTVLGQVFVTLGHYERAAELLASALAIRRALYGKPHEEVARTAQLLGEALHYDGRYAEAEQVLREAVDTRRRLFGGDDVRVAAALKELGDLLHSRGELLEADDVLRRALAIQIAIAGENSVDVAVTRRDLGNVRRDRGAGQDAELLYRRSLDVLHQRLGALDPVPARTRGELALLLAETGRYQEAQTLLEENVSVYAKLYPRGHAMEGTTFRNLGVLRLRQNRLPEAVEALERALDNYRGTLSEQNPLIPRVQRYQAEAALALGDAEAAARLASEALNRLRQAGLPNHPAVADALHTLGLARLAQDRPGEAAALLAEALAAREASQVPGDSRTEATRRYLRQAGERARAKNLIATPPAATRSSPVP